MSAFLVNHDTIDLLAAAINCWKVDIHTSERNYFGRTDYRELGQQLWAENVKSVNYRYDVQDDTDGYTYTPLDMDRAAVAIRPEILVLGAVRCLRYQSCEHPDYHESLGARILNAIESEAIRRLTNTDKAPWEYTRAWSDARRDEYRSKVGA